MFYSFERLIPTFYGHFLIPSTLILYAETLDQCTSREVHVLSCNIVKFYALRMSCEATSMSDS